MDIIEPIVMVGKSVGASIASKLTPHANKTTEVSNYCNFAINLHNRNGNVLKLEAQPTPDIPPGMYFRSTSYSVKDYRSARSYVNSWFFIPESEISINRCILEYEGGIVCSVADIPQSVKIPSESVLAVRQNPKEMEKLSTGFMLVDNHGRLPSIWLNLGGHIYRVDAQKSSTRPEGLHVEMTNNVTEGEFIPKSSMMHFSIEDIKDPKREGFLQAVFLSREDAVTYGDPGRYREMEHKEQLLLLKKESEEANLQVEQYKNECTVHSLKLEEQRKELEHYRTMQQAIKKDHFEERQYQRKDSLELWKMIPLALTALLAIVNLSK